MTLELDEVAVSGTCKYREKYHDPADEECPHRKRMDREKTVRLEDAERWGLELCSWCDPDKDNGKVYNKTPRRRSLRDILSDSDRPGVTS